MYTLSLRECQKQYTMAADFVNMANNRSDFAVLVYDTELCALGWRWPRDVTTCQGDSGGVLVCGGRASGVVSWGEGGCRGCRPAVFARVQYARDWILARLSEMSNKSDST